MDNRPNIDSDAFDEYVAANPAAEKELADMCDALVRCLPDRDEEEVYRLAFRHVMPLALFDTPEGLQFAGAVGFDLVVNLARDFVRSVEARTGLSLEESASLDAIQTTLANLPVRRPSRDYTVEVTYEYTLPDTGTTETLVSLEITSTSLRMKVSETNGLGSMHSLFYFDVLADGDFTQTGDYSVWTQCIACYPDLKSDLYISEEPHEQPRHPVSTNAVACDRPLEDPGIRDVVGGLVASGKYRQALERLQRFIEEPLPLFQGAAWVIEERRLAWLYRIDLLREWGRHTEALAWACLEVEMNPENVAAVALKERLKRESGLIRRGEESPDERRADPGHSRTAWKGVAGMRDLKAMLERDVILPLQEPEIYARYRLTLPNGILLYGPPGCGKTFIARKLAELIGFTFREVKPGDIASIYVHGTQGRIAELFDEARKQVPCMLFFDELDAMVPNRGGDSVGHHYASEVNEFLVRLNECSKQKILVVGATNLPARIDPAVLRPGRLDKKFFVGPPDYEARLELLRMNLAGRPQEKVAWRTCALELENYTCAEVEFIVNEAARLALSDKRAIVTGDILNAAGNNPPSHTPETVERMRAIN